MKRILLLCLLCVSVVSLSSCAARVPSSPGAPGRAGTPIENALAYNASLAQSNQSMAQLVINANNQTPPLMQSRVADLDRQLTPLLASSSSVGSSGAQIQQLLGEIQGAANGLVAGGDLGIKDAATQKAVLAAANGVLDFSGKVLMTLQAGGLLK
jgi:hypothetical protein